MEEEADREPMLPGAVYGLDALSLPKGWTPLEAIAIVKALDEDGEVVVCQRFTEGLSTWESVGLLITAADATREEMAGYVRREEREDDPDPD